MMKKLLFPSLCLIGMILGSWELTHAATYYVSHQGRDSYPGTSPDRAWRTLDKVNAMMPSFRPGDRILFRRGGRFAGQLLVTASGSAGRPITFGAYGSGDRPIIDGFRRLTQWKAVGSQLWKASYDSPQGRAYNLVANHRFQPLGRYPNADTNHGGYLPISGGNQWSQLESKALRGGPWTGGDVVVRSRRWILDRAPIVHHQGTRVSLAHRINYDVDNDYGFFIVNHRRALDQEGEWAYHHAERAMYLRSQRDPNTRAILTAHLATLVRLHRVQHVTVQQLELWGAAHDAVFINYSEHITVRNCRFYGSGRNGATVKYSQRTALLDNRFEHTNSNGVEVEQGKFTEVGGNTFLHTGLIPGMGASGNNTYCAIRSKSHHFNAHHNRIDQVGYTGISFVGDNINVQYNHVTNFCQIKDDGAGIYAGNSDPYPHRLVQVMNNIVGNDTDPSVAVGWGTDSPHFAHISGIYLDNHVNGVRIEKNTVYGSKNYGIYLHNAYRNVLKNNTLYDNWRALGMSHDKRAMDTKAVDAPIRNNTIQRNVLFARQKDQELLHLRSIKDDLFRFGTLSDNHYHSPLKHERVVRLTDRNHRSALYNIAQWKKASPYDQGSRAGTERWPSYVIDRYLSDNLLPNATFTDDVRGWQGWSRDGDGTIRHSQQAIDGGSLTMTFATRGDGSPLSVSASRSIGGLRQGERLVLRYSLQSNGTGTTLDTKLVNKGGPYRLLTNQNYVAADTKRQDVEEFFRVEHTTAESTLSVSVPKNEHRVHLDNVSLRKVATQPVDYDQYVQFLTNPSRQRVSRSLPGGRWTSVRGVTYRGSVKLEPFQSIILLRDSGELARMQATQRSQIAARSSAPAAKQVRQEEEVLPPASPEVPVRLYPNPLTEGPLTVAIDEGVEATEIRIYDTEGRLLVTRPATGSPSVTFARHELGTGLRFVRIVTPRATRTEKVLVQ